MFNKLIKKASKFFAVLITVTLTFTSLSYAEPVSNFEQFRSAVTSATTSSIEITTDITATDSGALGTQASNDLTIQGQGNTVDANNNGGMVVVNNVFVSDIKMSTFSSIAGGGVIFVSKDNGNLTVQDSIFTHNTSAQHGGTINISGEADIKNSEFSENKAKWGGAIYNEGNLNIERCSIYIKLCQK